MPPTEFSPQELQDTLRSLGLNNLVNILIQNNAIIAGGSVLSSTTRTYGLRDLDLYVNLRNAQNVYNSLRKDWGLCYVLDSHTAPPYDQSFLIKNNILGRFAVNVGPHIYLKTPIDIMIVSDDVSVESVVENFDLSFCKIWYDGRKILTNYPDDVRNKTGTLGADYLRAYLSGNVFTAKRIKKYNRRGFTINLPNINTSTISMERLKKQVISPEIWVVYKLFEELLVFITFSPRRENTDMELFSNMIFALQKLSEYKTTHRKSSLYNIQGFKDLLNFLYGDKLRTAAEADPTVDGGFWNINKLIYILICGNRRELCEWITPEYAEYYKSIGIQIRREDDVPAHGFENYNVPMCDGQIPPFSAGESGIPIDANTDYIKDLIRQGKNILSLTQEEKQNLYYTQYPTLRPLTHLERAERMREEQRLAAQRFALADDDEDEEEATGPYGLPNGSQVPGRCFSIMAAEDINTSSWYPEEDNILFLIEFYPGAEPDLVCTNVEILENALRNETGINYRCGGNLGFEAGTGRVVTLDNIPDGMAIDVAMTSIDFSVEYIPFSYGIDGTTSLNGYLPRYEVERILSQVGDGTSKLFTIVFRDTISHSVSKHNTSRGTEGANFVSTNHCQAGSTIMVFQVKEFIPSPEFGTPAPTVTPGGMGPTPTQTPPTVGQRLRRVVRTLWSGEDTPPTSPFREDPLEALTPETLEEVEEVVPVEGDEPTVTRVLFEGDEVVETPPIL